MQLIKEPISLSLLQQMAKSRFGTLVKAVVDVEKEVIVVDADLHADQEAFLLNNGSKQINLWGINLYPFLPEDQFIEFDSMINLRPSQKNNSRGVEDPKTQQKITRIVNKLIIKE